jgi:hypothetical protein
MKRLLLFLVIASLMAALVLASAMPAFAKPHKNHGCKPGSTGFLHSNGKCFHRVM